MVVPDHNLRDAGHDASHDRRLEVRPVLQHTCCWHQGVGQLKSEIPAAWTAGTKNRSSSRIRTLQICRLQIFAGNM